MKKLGIALIISCICISQAFAQVSSEGKRRIEEGKREELKTSEIYGAEAIEEIPEEKAVIDFEYFRMLLSRRVTYRFDGVAALALLIGIQETYPTIDDQVAYLMSSGIIPQRFHDNFKLDEPLRKGLAAYMFSKAIGLKGGIITRIFGMSERYAVQELVFQGVMYPGNVKDILNGKELVLLLSESTNYMLERSGESIDDMEEEEEG
ncbi:hypothetical protein N9934_00575 [Desulfosarcina sp.]|nr:hypothetical protein [Desulfosarcina sp.]